MFMCINNNDRTTAINLSVGEQDHGRDRRKGMWEGMESGIVKEELI